MKRKITGLLCLTVLALLVSCGGGKSALVGRWLLVEGRAFDSAEFLTDGTGIVDGNEVSWKVEKNRLFVSQSQQVLSFDYQLAGSKLTLTDENGDLLVCLKPGGPSALVGKWVPTEDFFFESIELSKGGKGNADGENFKWAADKKKLFIIDMEEFEYKVSGSKLTLTFDDETLELKKQ
jgi:hypothetical protein